MRLIDADALKYKNLAEVNGRLTHVLTAEEIDNAPTVNAENKIIELFNKYDILLVHMDGKIVPVKNSTKQECYNLLYEIQELIEWRKGKV